MATTTAALTLTSLPLFPLDAVLFPEGVLTLRVFEVRYLDMVRRCHDAGAPFGVVALSSGREVRAAGAPPEELHGIGTLAHITALQTVQAGLYAVECRGAERFRIDHSRQLKHGLWVADVTMLATDPAIPVPAALQSTAQTLRQLHHNLHQRAPNATLPEASDARYGDCGWVANRWCELLPLSAAVRQQFLGLDNPLLRLELVSELLSETGVGAPRS